jgi:hypothetical protein
MASSSKYKHPLFKNTNTFTSTKYIKQPKEIKYENSQPYLVKDRSELTMTCETAGVAETDFPAK